MTSKVYYSVKFSEEQLIAYLNRYLIYNPQEFNSNSNIVEITIAILAKKHFEETSRKSLLIAFEMVEKVFTTNLDLNNPAVVNDVLTKRKYDTLIDFMLVPVDKSNLAYAFQVKRFFIKATDKNIEGSLAQEINKYLNSKLSQEINLIMAPDKLPKLVEWTTKINLLKLKQLVKKRDSSYDQVFIMSDDDLIKI